MGLSHLKSFLPHSVSIFNFFRVASGEVPDQIKQGGLGLCPPPATTTPTPPLPRLLRWRFVPPPVYPAAPTNTHAACSNKTTH